MDFIFSGETDNASYGVKHELKQFHNQLNNALETLTESEKIDKTIFAELKNTIELSNTAIARIKEIYNISENLKVFAINSIVYSQKEGPKGKGYQIISGHFINLSEEIAKGTNQINEIGLQMNDQIQIFLNKIEEHEKFNHDHILAVSNNSQKLVNTSNKSVENFSMILSDLLSRIDSTKNPTYKIMVQLQKQDIIQQQMDHLMDIMNDILQILMDNSKLLNLNIEKNIDETVRTDYINISSLLDFLLLITEKQMNRINEDLLEMIDSMEQEFSQIYYAINDVNTDKDMITQLVIPESNADNEASIIHLIFQAPKNTIAEIINNLDVGRRQKKGIINIYSEINKLVLDEKKVSTTFIPIIESINNLLLLARIEQARNDLNISNDITDENSLFSQSAFSELGNIINDMDESEILINQNLNEINTAFSEQKVQYAEMEETLSDSLQILESTEKLFTDNYNSVMDITNTLSDEIMAYSGLFKKIRGLHNDMNNKIKVCDDIRVHVEKQLDKLGGPINLNECNFKDNIIQRIVEKLTVEEERVTIASEFTELNIEKTTGSSITLF